VPAATGEPHRRAPTGSSRSPARLADRFCSAAIHTGTAGSDHHPVVVELEV
jgi:hypothetical protein